MKARQEQLRLKMVEIVQAHAGTRMNGKTASTGTQQRARETLLETCNRLWRLGYEVEKPENINGKHIQALVQDWVKQGMSASTIRNQRSILNKFTHWIGKRGLVKKGQDYVPDAASEFFVVKTVSDTSKSWSANGVDIKQMFSKASVIDDRFADILRMELAFGLRLGEALQIKPWIDDHGTHLNIRPGIAKGGRPRLIPIKHELQRQVLDYVKSKYKQREHLGWTDPQTGKMGILDRNRSRYNDSMRKIGVVKSELGVTGHGLRAEFAENMAMLQGLIPATLGGQKGQMSREDERIVLGHVSEMLGHSEHRGEEIGAAYYGKLRSPEK